MTVTATELAASHSNPWKSTSSDLQDESEPIVSKAILISNTPINSEVSSLGHELQARSRALVELYEASENISAFYATYETEYDAADAVQCLNGSSIGDGKLSVSLVPESDIPTNTPTLSEFIKKCDSQTWTSTVLVSGHSLGSHSGKNGMKLLEEYALVDNDFDDPEEDQEVLHHYALPMGSGFLVRFSSVYNAKVFVRITHGTYLHYWAVSVMCVPDEEMDDIIVEREQRRAGVIKPTGENLRPFRQPRSDY